MNVECRRPDSLPEIGIHDLHQGYGTVTVGDYWLISAKIPTNLRLVAGGIDDPVGILAQAILSHVG